MFVTKGTLLQSTLGGKYVIELISHSDSSDCGQ